MPVVAPYIPTYASYTPYITAGEYTAAPTGVDVSQLVPGGTSVQNADALTNTIARASSWADDYCRQVLASTVDTTVGYFRINREGLIRVPVEFGPVVQVNSVSVGYTPSTVTALTDLTDVWIQRKVVTVPVFTSIPILQPSYNGRWMGSRLFTTVQYVNGYANTLTATATLVGGSTLVGVSSLGVIAGMGLTIYDPGATELVVVLSVVGNTITTVTPMRFAHGVGVSISAMPPSIKQAVIFYTSALIKTRGSESFEMPGYGAQPSKGVPMEEDGLQEIGLAQELLEPFRRVS